MPLWHSNHPIRSARRPGAIVACDNVRRLRREYWDYLNYIDNSAKGFDCLTLHMSGAFDWLFGADISSALATAKPGIGLALSRHSLASP